MSVQDQAGFWSESKELFRLLPKRQRREFFRVLILMVVGGVAELATVGAVIPFLSLLADPKSLDRFPLASATLDALAASTGGDRLVVATILFVVVAILAAMARLWLAWSSQKFTFSVGHELAVEVQRRVLLQPYSFHLGRHSSRTLASLEKIHALVFGVLQQIMFAGTSLFLSASIVAALIYVDPFAALVALGGFSVVYALVPGFTRRTLASNSAIVAAAYDERIKIVQESLGGIRDVIVDSSQPVYLDAFRKVDGRFNAANASTAFISAAPRFVIEALGMVLIAVVAVAISGREGGFALAFPILGALALGAQRILPLLQQIHVSWTLAAGNRAVLGQVLALLRLPADNEQPQGNAIEPLPFHERIEVRHVTFSYPDRRSLALRDISFEILSGSSVALIGETGSGKSTVVDLLLGLLEPLEGQITIDGIPLTVANRRRWQRSIAHVPQAIFLSDSSIARNIAFGVATDAVDLDRVIDASIKAQLHDFVVTLPDGYETQVGERGVRLSGGQRQRLGIARAIYKQTPVLVFDEATNALDDATENAVLSSLQTLRREGRTVLLIAHRPSTIAFADVVVRLDGGQIVELGSYAEVIGHS